MDTSSLITNLEFIEKKIDLSLPRDIQKLPPINFLIVTIFKSCISHFKSIILLLKSNMYQEAMVINDCLFTSIIFRYKTRR